MTDLILHSFRRCPFAIRVRVTLEEKGLSYRVIEEDLRAPSDALLKLNPEGRVPVLIDAGRALTESPVITQYLDDAYPEPKLMPESAFERARVRLWTVWCDTQLKIDLDLYKYDWDRSMNSEQREQVAHRVQSHVTELERTLDQRDYLVGNRLSLADIHVFPFYRQLKAVPHRPIDLSQYAKTNQWLDRIVACPSFLRAMEKP